KSLALPFLKANNSTGCLGQFGRSVSGVIVIYVNLSIRQRSSDVGDHLLNGEFLVETRYENSNARPDRTRPDAVLDINVFAGFSGPQCCQVHCLFFSRKQNVLPEY